MVARSCKYFIYGKYIILHVLLNVSIITRFYWVQIEKYSEKDDKFVVIPFGEYFEKYDDMN